MRRRRKSRNNGRAIPKQKTKKELKENFIESWSQFFYSIYDADNKNIEINGVTEYFNPVLFTANKIHIIRGDNGQGKTTLLKDIATSTSANVFNEMPVTPLKIMTNNITLGKTLNIPYHPYEDGLLGHNKLNIDLSNLDKNLTIYTDFSTDFFKKDNQLIDGFDMIQQYDKHSNGEQKISGINNILQIINVLKGLDEDKIQNNLNIIVIMDEPESGLSISIQKEFKRKLQFYLNKMNNKINLTFIIASHSYIWEKNKYIELHDINEFKKENSKKIYKRVFV